MNRRSFRMHRAPCSVAAKADVRLRQGVVERREVEEFTVSDRPGRVEAVRRAVAECGRAVGIVRIAEDEPVIRKCLRPAIDDPAKCRVPIGQGRVTKPGMPLAPEAKPAQVRQRDGSLPREMPG